MREPLPKALVRLAWKARVGYSAERIEIHRVYVEEREKTLKKRSQTHIKQLSLLHVTNAWVQVLTVTQVGTRSHLLRTRIRCLCGFSFFRYRSICLDRVPLGSRASSTYIGRCIFPTRLLMAGNQCCNQCCNQC